MVPGLFYEGRPRTLVSRPENFYNSGMKIALIGADGQLGSDLIRALAAHEGELEGRVDAFQGLGSTNARTGSPKHFG